MRECIVLAGGFGTRLQHLIPDTPKCLAPVGGKPFIDYLIQHLVTEKMDKFIFSLGYKSDMVESYIKTKFPHLNCEFCVESKPLGTGGAIIYSLGKCTSDQVFILNADTFYPISFDSFYKFYQKNKSGICIALKPIVEPDRYGTVMMDDQHKIVQFLEKKYSPYGLINGGIYLIDRKWILEFELPEIFSFETEILQKYTTTENIFGMVQDVPFLDIGIPSDYEKAQTFLPEQLSTIKKDKFLFLDRDGVINVLKENDYVRNELEFNFLGDILKELPIIAKEFKHIFIVTNQQGIGKGLMSESDLNKIHEKMIMTFEEYDVSISAIYHCPHLVSDSCQCRKPKPGMLDQAKQQFPELLFSQSVLIGDSISDFKMSERRGVTFVGFGNKILNELSLQDSSLSYHAMNFKEFRINVLPLL
ncbi:MAG: HAD-IIIA family hydrolase [Saprospiraceae bacterium]|nr:HAD-IIIA family hydrolase [Candidatus Vicinibacter affinis]MBP6173833.1 HAD-IIIA family hydrolase [Saprospiraceae bacterium]MBK6573034.1 HAD-IIIA family hydrolase [Candidatus Vicinibacter affinis]MBK6822504.1 HAD-IIIA family hydrolase [Candidatus Vicinibacter affinis]MBK7301715.1 HAD-IIIA family hydrolase [Candidatus Vicinibacter affinis]